jgi:hypothetical protein
MSSNSVQPATGRKRPPQRLTEAEAQALGRLALIVHRASMAIWRFAPPTAERRELLLELDKTIEALAPVNGAKPRVRIATARLTGRRGDAAGEPEPSE